MLNHLMDRKHAGSECIGGVDDHSAIGLLRHDSERAILVEQICDGPVVPQCAGPGSRDILRGDGLMLREPIDAANEKNSHRDARHEYNPSAWMPQSPVSSRVIAGVLLIAPH